VSDIFAPPELWHRLPDAGSYDTEDLYDFDVDRYKPSRLVVRCPCCDGEHRPLLSPHTERVQDGWRWVGLDYKQPEADFRARCPKTKTHYRFTTYVPQ
jgi:hypothetical protein